MKLNVFTSTRKDGIMSKDKKYFPNLTKEEINTLYEININRYLENMGLSDKHLIILTEKNNKLKSRVVTKTTKTVSEKILILKSQEKNVLIGVETLDDPVIVGNVTDKDGNMTSATALLTLENINSGIIHELIEALIRETDEAPFNMTFYISACPSKENYIVDNIDFLTDKYIWKNCIEKNKRKYLVDVRYAIFNQLISEIVDPNYIYFDQTDSKEDSKYFSKYSAKLGKNLVCITYQDN